MTMQCILAKIFIISSKGNDFIFMAWEPIVGQGLPIAQALRSQSITQIMLRRTTLDKWSAQRTTLRSQETDIYAPGRIQTCNPSEWVDADPCLRLRGHWDQRGNYYLVLLFKLNLVNYAALNLLNYQIQHQSISIVIVSHDRIHLLLYP
jgi:hypothetical protein